MKQLEVQIMGQSYMLTCPENTELRLREAVARVDSAMCTIRDHGKVKSRDRIAVLAALNLTFELLEPLPFQTLAAPPQAPSPPSPAPDPSLQDRADETGPTAPNSQLETLLQRLNTALATNGRRP